MNSEFAKKNNVEISGVFASELTYSHEIFGERFCTATLMVRRLSGICDFIPVMFSNKLISENSNLLGKSITVRGQFRSYDIVEGDKARLLLFVFARDVDFTNSPNSKDNEIVLDGHICKKPVYRQTRNGREILEIMIASNRPYGKSDYIPCICWGRDAKYIKNFTVGTRCIIYGRIQSREYVKRLGCGMEETRTAYEVSVSRIDVVESEDNEDESRS